jgi:hypothetical protein
MNRLAAVACVLMLSTASLAQDSAAASDSAEGGFAPQEAAEVDFDALLYVSRAVIVFADTPNDPRFVEQMAMIEARWDELASRNVVVVVDTDPAAASEIRTRLRPRGFNMVILDQDGRVALRKPFPWDVRELSRAIDRMR